MAPLLIGLAITSVNIIVHALILGMIVMGVRRDLMRGRVATRFVVTIVMNATLLLLAGHFIEMALWGLSFVLCGEFPNFGAAFLLFGGQLHDAWRQHHGDVCPVEIVGAF